MYYSITGGNKKQRSLIESIVTEMAPIILGRIHNSIDVDFKIKRNLDADGWCEWMDDNLRPREFKIEVRAEQSIPDLILTICHELVHVRQMAKRELYEIFRPNHMRVWKGKRLEKDPSYRNQPWEKEAYRLQSRYAKEFVIRTGFSVKTN